ncbi:hypothetical protein ACFY12_08760 [Streptomyces sp. NPDC001339]|uniref:hypothetical protein n=1 Tax=Streptomyces sp. NPDC001339 TaxID=3364563 RepID=UPI003693B614
MIGIRHATRHPRNGERRTVLVSGETIGTKAGLGYRPTADPAARSSRHPLPSHCPARLLPVGLTAPASHSPRSEVPHGRAGWNIVISGTVNEALDRTRACSAVTAGTSAGDEAAPRRTTTHRSFSRTTGAPGNRPAHHLLMTSRLIVSSPITA